MSNSACNTGSRSGIGHSVLRQPQPKSLPGRELPDQYLYFVMSVGRILVPTFHRFTGEQRPQAMRTKGPRGKPLPVVVLPRRGGPFCSSACPAAAGVVNVFTSMFLFLKCKRRPWPGAVCLLFNL